MKIRFLGTGTSTGNPEIGCTCPVCTSSDKRDNRLRASILVCVNNKNILIDCGPDFRQQMLPLKFQKIEALLLTHEHYDHVGGIDDLRPFCRFGDIEIFLEKYVADSLRQRMPYCFEESKYPGVPILKLNEITDNPFWIGDICITPIRLLHYKLPIFGYRIGNMAYLTDMKSMGEAEYEKLQNLDVLIIDALRIEEHISHLNLEQSLEYVKRIAPKKAYLIHMSHHMGLHAEVEKILPDNVYLSYDGLEIELE